MKQQYKGILCITLAAFFFALMAMFVRLAGDVPVYQKSFFRNLVAACFAIVMLKRDGGGFRWKKGNLKYLLVRSAFGTFGVLCNFYTVDHLVLADATMLNKMSPFFVVILSVFVLKEKVTPTQILIVIGAFAGSLFVIKPTFANMELFPSVIGILGGLGAGVAYTMVRKLGERGERGALIVFFFSVFSCLSVLPWCVMAYHPMTAQQIWMLLLAGVSAAGGQFTITAAYSYAPAREISVFDYSQILFSSLLGFLVFGQLPDILSVLGYLIICGMAVCMFLYNKKRSEKSL